MSKIGFLKTLWERKNNKNNKLGKVLKARLKKGTVVKTIHKFVP